MSLTNPKDVVTEERLSEFYQGIFPYLGGMPEMLANKFSRSDIYSDNETLVGVWRDGKPLYRKTVNCGALPNNTTKNVAHGISNLETLIKWELSSLKDSDNMYWPSPYTSSESINYQLQFELSLTNITLITHVDWSSVNAWITLYYTKTTDSPIAIGSESDYDSTEKIVGTWFGEWLYQKTVTTGGNVPSGATLILRTAMASTGYDTILYTK